MRPFLYSVVLSVFAVASFAAHAVWQPSLPTELKFNVCETQGIYRHREIVSSGIPVPESLNVTDVSQLKVFDKAGEAIESQFRILGRWKHDKSQKDAPVKWVLVHFPANVAANQCQTYELRVVTSPQKLEPEPVISSIPSYGAPALTLSSDAQHLTVDTGKAAFVISRQNGELFQSIGLNAEQILVGQSAITAKLDDTDAKPDSVRSISVEEEGPLKVVIRADSIFNLPAVGATSPDTGLVSLTTRYEFRAGSPTVVVRSSIQWEGDRCSPGELSGTLSCKGQPNARLVKQLLLDLPFVSGARAEKWQFRTEAGNALQTLNVSDAPTLSIEQLLRTQTTDPLRYRLSAADTVEIAGKADAAVLAASGAKGTIAISLNHMHRFEPQSIQGNQQGLQIGLISDKTWLGPYSGLYAQFAISAFTEASEEDILSENWALLNAPLRAWPEPRWFAASGAVGEFPYSKLADNVAAYDDVMAGIMAQTKIKTDEKGLAGISTFGLYPRYWADPVRADELSCKDPTPEESWDTKFWCGTWTDYHNTLVSVPIWVMRSGDVSLLDDIAFPGALRVLHTQMFQCAPSDTFFRCGQAPSGYGAYRGDNNSSHGYFDNLILYYWLTGDEMVIDKLGTGAIRMRNFLCNTRSDKFANALCAPTHPITDEWASINGRVAVQWLRVFRFLGESLNDDYLDDWYSTSARWLTQYFAIINDDSGKELGFTVSSGAGKKDYISGAGTYKSAQVVMSTLYDMDLLYYLAKETSNKALGIPLVTPVQALQSWANTIIRIGSVLPTGLPKDAWPNIFQFTFSGDRIGGHLIELRIPELNCGNDSCLYAEAKLGVGAVLMRAGDLGENDGLIKTGVLFTEYGLDKLRYLNQPLNKITGAYLYNLHSAVARVSENASPSYLSVFAGIDKQLSKGVMETTLFGDSPSREGTLWSQVAGPVSALITQPYETQSSVHFTTPGSYQFDLTVDGSEIKDSVTIVLSDVSKALVSDKLLGLPDSYLKSKGTYRLAYWNNDSTARTGIVDLLTDDLKRNCSSSGKVNLPVFYSRVLGEDNFTMVSEQRLLQKLPSCGNNNYADAARIKIGFDAGRYQIVACFSTSLDALIYCTEPFAVEIN